MSSGWSRWTDAEREEWCSQWSPQEWTKWKRSRDQERQLLRAFGTTKPKIGPTGRTGSKAIAQAAKAMGVRIQGWTTKQSRKTQRKNDSNPKWVARKERLWHEAWARKVKRAEERLEKWKTEEEKQRVANVEQRALELKRDGFSATPTKGPFYPRSFWDNEAEKKPGQ